MVSIRGHKSGYSQNLNFLAKNDPILAARSDYIPSTYAKEYWALYSQFPTPNELV